MTGCAFCGMKGFRVCDQCHRRNVVAEVVGLMLKPDGAPEIHGHIKCKPPRYEDVIKLDDKPEPVELTVELTVEDVLGVLKAVCNDGWEARTPKGYARVARWAHGGEDGHVLDHEDHEGFTGTLRDVLTEAKKRGLL